MPPLDYSRVARASGLQVYSVVLSHKNAFDLAEGKFFLGHFVGAFVVIFTVILNIEGRPDALEKWAVLTGLRSC